MFAAPLSAGLFCADGLTISIDWGRLNSCKTTISMYLLILTILSLNLFYAAPESLSAQHATIQEAHVIHWNDKRLLTWEDFNGKASPNDSRAALTYSSLHAQFGYNERALEFAITCTFDKNKSWGRVKNDYILAHEQRHFDLTEVFARKLNKELSSYKFNNRTVGDDINVIYQSVVNDLTSTQQTYDRETDHSRNMEQQGIWNKKIDSLLNNFSQYKNYRKTMSR